MAPTARELTEPEILMRINRLQGKIQRRKNASSVPYSEPQVPYPPPSFRGGRGSRNRVLAGRVHHPRGGPSAVGVPFNQAGPSRHVTTNSSTNDIDSKHTLIVEGVRFYVTNGGKKLVKVESELGQSNLSGVNGLVGTPIYNITDESGSVPARAIVSGVEFRRSSGGNLVRTTIPLGSTAASADRHPVPKLNEPCRNFSTTGSCSKGPKCRRQHDPNKVAICKTFLQSGSCPLGDSCDLSHDPTPERMPTCVYFEKGTCSNFDCIYAHADLGPNALNCRQFGLYGYCSLAAECPERHSFACPDFTNTGKCDIKGCKLMHRERASVLRMAPGTCSTTREPSSPSSEPDVASRDNSTGPEARRLSDTSSSAVPDNDFAGDRDFIHF